MLWHGVVWALDQVTAHCSSLQRMITPALMQSSSWEMIMRFGNALWLSSGSALPPPTLAALLAAACSSTAGSTWVTSTWRCIDMQLGWGGGLGGAAEGVLMVNAIIQKQRRAELFTSFLFKANTLCFLQISPSPCDHMLMRLTPGSQRAVAASSMKKLLDHRPTCPWWWWWWWWWVKGGWEDDSGG